MSSDWQLICAETGATVVARLIVADRFWSRFKGLQWRRRLPDAEGLLLVPCRSVHTFWMRFSIDILFLDETGRVLEIRRRVPPWRMVIPSHGRPWATLEIAADTACISPGATLRLACRDQGRPLPPSLRFLIPPREPDTGNAAKDTAVQR